MSLTRARVILATGGFGRQVTAAIAALLASPCDHVQLAAEVLAMRRAAESDHITRRPREIFDDIVVAAAEPARDHGAESCHHGLDPD